MSLNLKIAAACIAFVLAIGVGIVISKNRAIAPTSGDDMATTTGSASTSTGAAPSASVPASSAGKSSVSSAQSGSASVDKDMAAIDAQLNAIVTDDDDAGKSMNDKAIEQTY
jgi:hypothetical protein